MRGGRKIALVLFGLAVVSALLLSVAPTRALRDLEATRRQLRREGFKIDLKEFDLSLTPELNARAALIGTTTRAALTNRSRLRLIPLPAIPFMVPVETNAALVRWKSELAQFRNEYEPPIDLWAQLRGARETNHPPATTLAAAISGPIRFEPIGFPAPNPLLPYLADLKNLTTAFGLQMLLALHEGDGLTAWSNLLAATCLVTSYQPEPIDISRLVQFGCAALAYDITWSALQWPGWTDAQLEELQQRWEGLDIWSHLPETAAMTRANAAALLQMERQSMNSGLTLKGVFQHPTTAWDTLRSDWQRFRYRRQGSFEDEKEVMVYFRDRELDLRRAIQISTWTEMQALPGATNHVPFATGRGPSAALSMLNSRQLVIRWQAEGQTLLGRAAETESRRRIIICSIALERFHRKCGRYPNTLSALCPDLLKAAPIDFMDGKPLRYRLIGDGHFLLYSTGLDSKDDGGELKQRRAVRQDAEDTSFHIGPYGRDLVWPRPASDAEVQTLVEERARIEAAQILKQKDYMSDLQWKHSATRQRKVDSILSSPFPPASVPGTNRNSWRDKMLSQDLSSSGRSIAELLTLKQTPTGREPEIITFELPVRYEAVNNVGTLHLYVDPVEDEDSDEGAQAAWCEFKPASNGNCLLLWNPIYESPGKHALCASLDLRNPRRPEEIDGPVIPFEITNLCQFSFASSTFDHKSGVFLAARFAESNATYTADFLSTKGDRLKSVSGTTSNGIMKVHWDLVDEHGNLSTNEEFNTVLHLTLPDSGRSQTLKGP